MKRITILVGILLASLSACFAQKGDDVKGIWLNDKGDAKVEIYKSGDRYFGKISWLKDMYEPGGKTIRKDVNNTNQSLRSREVLNMVILSGFKYDDDEWTGGELYDPKTGKTYKSKMKLKNGSLEIRGYVGSPMFGKTTTWTKS